ncbi:TetR/AcrR family transcriptional regulator [Nocardioides marmoriginsengisoli]|uniref:TetR/AcrR family transcriptional regulator n=1 Tax=Nocardioides marmoriginsengisoli TaxID=661483 RepID=A0A3N0CG82_9ACTN|nr:TetR/AcrR family transcriptional regulator [Nocardioides marmoriginsengisoli]RNL62482.1 TetR/AcrR family transcriptional regulator [Nocardioides marmoriginsengisoli]
MATNELAEGGAKRMAFQREHEHVSPRGLFDQVEPKGSRRFLTAAVVAFSGRGYHATTTRDIATLAGSSPAGIYTYYATKADLLYEISVIAHQYILDETIAAVAVHEDPIGRISEVVRRSVTYHAEEHVLARVVNTDFRALDVPRLAAILKMRRQISTIVRDEVARGVELGVFDVNHIEGATIAILRLLDVAPWYNERGPMSPAELAEVYVALILKMVGASHQGGDRDAAVNG